MSPAEASFTALLLIQQKLTNPEYQVAPEVWTATVEARIANQRMASADTPAARTELRVGPSPAEDVVNVRIAIDREAHIETSALVRAAHRLLDGLGVQQ